MKGVKFMVDHAAIVWCYEVLDQVTKVLMLLISTKHPEGTTSLKDFSEEIEYLFVEKSQTQNDSISISSASYIEKFQEICMEFLLVHSMKVVTCYIFLILVTKILIYEDTLRVPKNVDGSIVTLWENLPLIALVNKIVSIPFYWLSIHSVILSVYLYRDNNILHWIISIFLAFLLQHIFCLILWINCKISTFIQAHIILSRVGDHINIFIDKICWIIYIILLLTLISLTVLFVCLRNAIRCEST